MRKEIIEKTDAFMVSELMKAAEFRDNTVRMAEYRIEHSRRVAHISAEIARKEGFDAERAAVAGLLHDIGYSIEYSSREDYINHGRYGAEIARPFLTALGYPEAQVNEMCYGIAIHVDDRSDFPGERTPLALTVQDADNIDRFDAFRLYEWVTDANYRDLPLSEQEKLVDGRMRKLERFRELPYGTRTATALWQEKLDFQLEFCRRLKNQIDKGRALPE